MSQHITIRMSVATDKLDSACVDEVTIKRTDWDAMTQQEQHDFVQAEWADHKANYLHGTYSVLDESGNVIPEPQPVEPPTHYLVKVRTVVGEVAVDSVRLVQADTEEAARTLALLSQARSEVGQGAEWDGDTLYDMAGAIAYSCKGIVRVQASDLLTLQKYI